MKVYAFLIGSCLLMGSISEAQSVARYRALELFKAITGVAVSIDDPIILRMETAIGSSGELAAAKIATSDKRFYDVRLRDIAKRMSNRDETKNVEVNDFVATFVGAARDKLDARQLLTGNFYYKGDATKAVGLPSEATPDLLHRNMYRSNNHYRDLESNNNSLFETLIKIPAQVISYDFNTGVKDASGNDIIERRLRPMPDPAGLLTTRAFIQAHGSAGTNRRLVEYTFREFMCVAMTEWMDGTRPDNFVARDVDRFPGGSNEKYQSMCKQCHSQMDAFRPAFAHINWDGSKIETSNNVFGKLNGRSVFSDGYVTTNDSWMNYATGAKNSDQFAWRTQGSGNGLKEFGNLIANSKGFSRCMTKRLFTEICKRQPGYVEETSIRKMADEFERDYQLTSLAEIVAVHPLCLPRY